jgi:hypothetical protein
MKRFVQYVGRTILLLLTMLLFLVPLSVQGFGQTPNNALQFTKFIPLPNWTSAASFDALWFDAQNGIAYIADRINDGATAIDAKTMTYVGTSVAPGCGVSTATTAPSQTNCRPSGILVTSDTQKLIFTGRGPSGANTNAPPPGIWVFDLKAPTAPPVLIQTALAPDFVDYDPVNQFVYVKTAPPGNSDNPIYITDPVAGKVVGQLSVGAGIEQLHFNPVDGFIYVAITDAGKQAMAKVDPVTNNIVNRYPLISPSGPCTPHQFEIDPTTDIAVVGCSEVNLAMDLSTGKVINTYPLNVNTDTTGYDLNLHHLYLTTTGGVASSGCPQDSTGSWPVIGVVASAPAAAPLPTQTTGQYIGVACGGRGEKGAAADPVNHNIFVATPQYPVNAGSANTGQAGVMVFHDAAPSSAPPARSQATLGTNGTATISLDGRAMRVFASLSGLTDAPTHLVVTTTAGNEIVQCNEAGGAATCSGVVAGDPLIGGVVLLANSGALLSKGTITAGTPLVVTGLTFDTTASHRGSSYGSTVAGTGLTAQTYFDIRFRAPGSTVDSTANNWQTGATASQTVAAATPTGTWTITGVRAHSDPADHTSNFVTVSTTLMVQ